ncbi:unnamed protein product, partial [Didymodactylos carnosus]
AYVQKNIRHRVCVAVNVLIAMNIISKDQKDIRCIEFSVNALFECEVLDLIDDLDCLDRLGLSNELRAQTNNLLELEKAGLLLPETFHDFVTEMCLVGTLRTLYERVSIVSNTQQPQYQSQQYRIKSKQFATNYDEQEPEYIVDNEKNDDVLSWSSNEEIENKPQQQQQSECLLSEANIFESDRCTLITTEIQWPTLYL